MTNKVNIVTIQIFKSPVGNLILGEVNGLLCLCDWTESKHHHKNMGLIAHHFNAEFCQGMSPTLTQAANQLNEYFGGQRTHFDITPTFYGTKFQKEVWHQLLHVPYGTTTSYSHIANAIGRPTAIRAVANAIAANPISIFVPCHRILGSNGSLTGYAGGLSTKQYLLNLENGCNS